MIAINLSTAIQNLLKYSEQFQTAIWTITGSANVSINSPDVLAPNGTNAADSLNDTDVNSDLAYIQQNVTVLDDSVTRTFSIYLKERTSDETSVFLFFTGGTIVTCGVTINWATGDITQAAGTGEVEIQSVIDGWSRIRCTVANNSLGNTTAICRIYPAGRGNTDTGAVWVWGAQLVESDSINPYIVTTDTSITDATDTIDLSPEYDIKDTGQKIEDIHRTKEGSQYRYLWGSFDKVEFSLRYVNTSIKKILNDWWYANTDLIYTNNFTAESKPVHISNRSKPIDKIIKPYFDQFSGKISLEEYE